jgi:predicted acylesterase/phospholipase RssA
MLPPKRIALSGGGMKGISHVGALEVLEERGLLKGVKEYIGTSAGALIGLCMCIGYTLSELRAICMELDFSLAQNLDPEIIMQFLENFGFDDAINTDKLLTILLKAKRIDPNITFEEFARQFPNSPRLRVYAVEIQRCTNYEFSLEKTPRTELRTAVRASSSIPIYFKPVYDVSSNNVYVDGGLIAHLPFHHLTTEERNETIAIAFSNSITEPVESLTLMKYMLKLYYSVYTNQNKELYKDWGHRIIMVPCGDFPSTHFGASSSQKEELIKTGREGALEFLSNPPTNRKKNCRRHSL